MKYLFKYNQKYYSCMTPVFFIKIDNQRLRGSSSRSGVCKISVNFEDAKQTDHILDYFYEKICFNSRNNPA